MTPGLHYLLGLSNNLNVNTSAAHFHTINSNLKKQHVNIVDTF